MTESGVWKWGEGWYTIKMIFAVTLAIQQRTISISLVDKIMLRRKTGDLVAKRQKAKTGRTVEGRSLPHYGCSCPSPEKI